MPRRRPQARSVSRLDLRPLRRMGAGVSRGRSRNGHTARGNPPRGQRRWCAVGRADGETRRREESRRLDHADDDVCRLTFAGAEVGRPGWVRVVKGFAQLRSRARPCLRRRACDTHRPRVVCRGAPQRTPESTDRRRRPSERSGVAGLGSNGIAAPQRAGPVERIRRTAALHDHAKTQRREPDQPSLRGGTATGSCPRTCRGPTPGAAGTSSAPATVTCRGRTASAC